MKLVMTLLARDEADVVDAQLAFHLNAGVDYVVATDNRSQDGTTDILERYAREGHLHLIREESEGFHQGEWVTRMAQLAAAEFGANWVINSDADEFWWPRGGSLKDVLEAVPGRYGVLAAPVRHFFLRPDNSRFFAERMVVRSMLNAPINEPGNPLRPKRHIVHRGDPHAVVSAGNHALLAPSLVLLSGWHPVEVLHFPLRSMEQCRSKYAKWVHVRAGKEYRDAYDAYARGELEEFVRSKILDDDVVERGVADGSLVVDTRVRDALRTLAAGDVQPGGFALPRDRIDPLVFAQPSIDEDVAYAVEAAVLAEADVVRLQRRLDELDARLALLERGLGRRIGRRMRQLLRPRRALSPS